MMHMAEDARVEPSLTGWPAQSHLCTYIIKRGYFLKRWELMKVLGGIGRKKESGESNLILFQLKVF